MTSEPQRHELDLGFTKTIKETTIIVKIKIKEKKEEEKRRKKKRNKKPKNANSGGITNTQHTTNTQWSQDDAMVDEEIDGAVEAARTANISQGY